MWGLDHKEGWMSKNQCFSTVVLEKTPESPLDSKEIRQILYQLSHKGSPRILEWVTYPSSSGSFWPRNWIRVYCIAGGFFTNWAIRETPVNPKGNQPWIFIGRTGAEAEAPILWLPDVKSWLTGKDPELGKIKSRRRGQQRMRWFDGIIESVDMSLSKFPGKFWRIGKPSVLQAMG